MRRLILLVSICITITGFSQTKSTGSTKRILILLDGSGSMIDPWNGTNKWEVAQKLVLKTIDSIQKTDPDVQIGLRVFGHQSPRAAHNCEDSKLEVPIGFNSLPAIKSAFKRITPQGYTPIAYSLFVAAGDFISTEGTNSIILITDGIENCDGDPCASSTILRDKKITLKPFIIGVGLKESDKKSFECVGSFYDADDETTFSNAMSIVISQALNITTTQVNLIDGFGLPTEKDIELTFYDSFSGEIRYNFVHTLNYQNQPDTLFLNPIGKYNIIAHTTPIVELNNVELTPGKHNIIGIDVPQGNLQILEGNGTTFSEKQATIRSNTTGEIIYVENFNTKHKFIADTYDIDILTLPRLHYENYLIKAGVENKIDVPLPGTLNISSRENRIYSIYTNTNGKLEKIYEATLSGAGAAEAVQLLPGDYIIFSRSNVKKTSANTKESEISIKSSKSSILKL